MSDQLLSVLFIDDEPAVLDGLRRALYRRRVPWHMRFACGGGDGIAQADAEPPQVVVTDIRMPHVSGHQVLLHMARAHPQVVRMVLSGYSEHEEALRLAGLAHQYLPKPCDTDRLIQLVERASAVRGLLDDAGLLRAIAGTTDVPVHPAILDALRRELSVAHPDIDTIADLAHRDPGLAVKLLKLANAPLLCPAGGVVTARQAVMLIGLERLRSLTLVMHLFVPATPAELDILETGCYRRTQSVVEVVNRLLELEQLDPVVCDQARLAAVLHDIGRIVLMRGNPEDYARTDRECDLGRCARERQAYGCSHPEVGALLLDLWHLPIPLVEAVRHHHDLSQQVTGGQFDLVAIIAIANALVDEQEPDAALLASLGKSARWPQWRALCGGC